MHNKNEVPKTRDKKVVILKKRRQTLWFIEVLYEIKWDVLWLIAKLYAKNQSPKSKDEKVKSL